MVKKSEVDRQGKVQPSKGKNIWRKYRVTIDIRDRILGGIPKATELIGPWLQGRGVPEPVAKDMKDGIAKETFDGGSALDDETKKAWTTFKTDGSSLIIEERQIKALFKESAKVLGLTRRPGMRDGINHGLCEIEYVNLTRLIHDLSPNIFSFGSVVKPEKIILKRNGAPILKPDGFIEQPIHVMGPQEL